MKQNKNSAKKWWLDQYDSITPDKMLTEDIDGSFYPKELKEPDIAYIPPAEPHVYITDLYDNPQDWYFIREIIPGLIEQSYVSYYRGVYTGSFLCSMSVLELTIKYEFVRRGILQPKDLENITRFSKYLDKSYLKKIRLAKFHKDIITLYNLRNGILHFNPVKLKNAVKKIIYSKYPKGETPVVITFDENEKSVIKKLSKKDIEDEYSVPTDNYEEWSRLANFSYTVMHNILTKLYGEKNRIKFLKEGIEDYDRKKRRKNS